ncbi:MAG: 6-carboxytetrahydropterin synthase QueD [Candidatus Desulfofervidaceae bacterium]|nr:6-carboxytetrahydropterin synthase QueD [Candidatus Desulfofervidaceae bacterium]
MYGLRIISHFAAAHRLRDYRGKCETLHGHNWKVEVYVVGNELNKEGILIDFKELKSLVKKCLERLDHTYLNDLTPFDKENPTSEHIARYIFHFLKKHLPPHVSMKKVTVWESETACAEYWERDVF